MTNVTFDVVCLGEVLWDLHAPRGVQLGAAHVLHAIPGGAAMNVARWLARIGLRPALCASISDDAIGRGMLDRATRDGIDTSLVAMSPVRTGLVFIEHGRGNEGKYVSYRKTNEETLALRKALPERWNARILYVGGILPTRGGIALARRAMRAARREGCFVVLDPNIRRKVWAGGPAQSLDPMALLAEVDCCKCSVEDLVNLGMVPNPQGLESLRGRMRRSATLVVTHGGRPAKAMGAFGTVARSPRALRDVDTTGAGDAFAAGLIEIIAASNAGDRSSASFWRRALEAGHARAMGQLERGIGARLGPSFRFENQRTRKRTGP